MTRKEAAGYMDPPLPRAPGVIYKLSWGKTLGKHPYLLYLKAFISVSPASRS